MPEINARQFAYEHLGDEFGGTVAARAGDREVGRLDYTHSSLGGVFVEHLHVDPAHRRRGVAGRMYEVGYDHHESPYLHDDTMTPEGRATAEANARRNPGMHRFLA